MIKESIVQLIHELNRLDSDSDTLLLIDWKSRTVLLAQRPNEQFISNNFWILLESTREFGKSLDMISSSKLNSLKHVLMRVLNNFNDMQLVPGKYGFSTKSNREFVYHGKVMNLWNTESIFKFRNNMFMKLGLFILSSQYRSLRRSLLKTKFDENRES